MEFDVVVTLTGTITGNSVECDPVTIEGDNFAEALKTWIVPEPWGNMEVTKVTMVKTHGA